MLVPNHCKEKDVNVNNALNISDNNDNNPKANESQNVTYDYFPLDVDHLEQKFFNMNIESNNNNSHFNINYKGSNDTLNQRKEEFNGCLSNDLLKKLENLSPAKTTKVNNANSDNSFSLDLMSPQMILSPCKPTKDNYNRTPHRLFNNNPYQNFNININNNQYNLNPYDNNYQNAEDYSFYYNNSNMNTNMNTNMSPNMNHKNMNPNNMNPNTYTNDIHQRNFSQSIPSYNPNTGTFILDPESNMQNNYYTGTSNNRNNNPNNPNQNYPQNFNNLHLEESNPLKRYYSINEKNLNNMNYPSNNPNSNFKDNKNKSINCANTFNKVFSGKNGWFCSECKNFNFESKHLNI